MVPVCSGIMLGRFPTPASWPSDSKACARLLPRKAEKAISNKISRQKLPFWEDFLKQTLTWLTVEPLFPIAFCKISVLLKKTTRCHLHKAWIALGVGFSMILPARDSDQCSSLKKDCFHGGQISLDLALRQQKCGISTGLSHWCAADPAAEVHTPLCCASYPTGEELGQQQTLVFCQKHNMHKTYFEGMNTKA